MGILVRVLSYFPSFPFPLLLSSLFPPFLSLSSLQMHLLDETEKKCGSGLLLSFGETCEAVVWACIAFFRSLLSVWYLSL